jgi:hypothetical protein
MAALLFSLAFGAQGATLKPTPAAHARKLWDGAAAMRDIRRQLSFGPRAMGAPGHARTIAMIQAEFARLGVRTTLQTWSEPTAGGPLQLTNIIARFDPDNPHRIILGTHYDSIIRAYADPHDPRAIMPGANNSASGRCGETPRRWASISSFSMAKRGRFPWARAIRTGTRSARRISSRRSPPSIRVARRPRR